METGRFYIERVEVDGGFLNGLNVSLRPGLNVLIGARGTGKTSLVELIRFCLGVPALTETFESTTRGHALSVLGEGEVAITLSRDGQRVLVRRGSEEPHPRLSQLDESLRPTILSQGEIEFVGRDAAGRLRLLDESRERQVAQPESELGLAAVIRSLTVELASVSREMNASKNEIDSHKNLPAEIDKVKAEESGIQKALGELQDERATLNKLGEALAALAVRGEVLERTRETLARWRSRLREVLALRPVIEDWPKSAHSKDPLVPVREAIHESIRMLEEASSLVGGAVDEVSTAHRLDEERVTTASERARQLRRQLDAAAEGAGAITRKLAQLQKEASRLSALKDLLKQKEAQLEDVHQERRKLLDDLDLLRERRFQERARAAQELNQRLGPRIKIEVRQFGLHSEYASAISAGLRGSGLKYNLLSPVIARNMAPRELIEAVEAGDVATIARVGQIDEARAQRIVEALKDGSACAEILVSPLEDSVELYLLDGDDYKPTEEQSLGQKCTVVLPILLSQKGKGLIIDQPEDNLDNAFIVETLIRAIRERSKGSQLLFATHNPNIPVIGDASQVLVMGSDGRRGYVEHSGDLKHPSTVDAITSIMEGGREAFETRARFYRDTVTPGGI